MIFPLLLLIGVAVFAASGSARRAAMEPPRAPVPLPPPGPLFVLSEYGRIGAVPPPPVVLCAIAEAQVLGRIDIANDIMRIYVLPVVEQAAIARARPANTATDDQRRYGPSAPYPVPVQPTQPSSPAWTPEAQLGPDIQFAIDQRRNEAVRHHPHHEQPPQVFAFGNGSDDDIQAMLDRDPRGFVQAAMHTPGVIDVEPSSGDFATQPGSAWAGQFPDGHPLSVNPMREPPIDVPSDAWSGFCDRLRREDPSYQSKRHVGCFRQCKDRLVELGINPEELTGSEEAQRDALDRDIADAYGHVAASGLADHYVGREIYLAGNPAPIAITLSGILGVAQAAGLDGAASWLEHAADRRRFKHTTEAFVKTNGLF